MARAKREAGSEYNFYETRDVDGNVVRIPFPTNPDKRFPEKDDDGNIPMFVNITDKNINLTIPSQPDDTIRLAPMGVVPGAQFRKYTKENKAWGVTPPLMERKMVNGKFDSTYLLSEDQMIELVDKRVRNSEFGRNLIQVFLANAKRQSWSEKEGKPILSEDELAEDRPKVAAFLSKRLNVLERIWKQRKKAMETGQPIANPIKI